MGDRRLRKGRIEDPTDTCLLSPSPTIPSLLGTLAPPPPAPTLMWGGADPCPLLSLGPGGLACSREKLRYEMHPAWFDGSPGPPVRVRQMISLPEPQFPWGDEEETGFTWV